MNALGCSSLRRIGEGLRSLYRADEGNDAPDDLLRLARLIDARRAAADASGLNASGLAEEAGTSS